MNYCPYCDRDRIDERCWNCGAPLSAVARAVMIIQNEQHRVDREQESRRRHDG